MIEYSWKHTVDWGECDPARIVFYPNIYAWFDKVSHKMMKAHGFGQSEMIRQHGIVGFPLIETHAEFLYPMSWEETVTIMSRIGGYSEKTFTVNHEVYNADAQLCVRGYEIRFWGKLKGKSATALKAISLPDEFTRCLVSGQGDRIPYDDAS